MDLPKPPEEPEVKNIIDKLANFVARNGLAFERMTKEKQKNNPKFAFLFGGEHYNYYQYKLTTEQQILNQQRSQMNAQQAVQEALVQQSLQNAPWQQQQQSNFSGFPPGPPQIQQGMPPRPLQPIPPWQQQQQQRPPAPWQQPPLHMAGPNSLHPPHMHPPSVGGPPGPTPLMMVKSEPTGLVKQESDLEKEEEDVKKKIKESEDNLKQQYEVLMKQRQNQIHSALQKRLDEQRISSASRLNVSLSDFDNVLQPIIDSCTKDSIANGKSWILSNSSSEERCDVIVQQLLHRVVVAAKSIQQIPVEEGKKKLFDTQLHIIYLINDVLHHASRKNLTNLSEALESVIVPIFSTTQSCANEQHQQRLSKLLGLWDRFNYFSEETMNQMSDPQQALAMYMNKLEDRFSDVVQDIKTSTQKQYEQFEKQHNDYANHIKSQVEKKRKEFEDQKMQNISSNHPGDFNDRDQRAPPGVSDDFRGDQYQGGSHRGPDNMEENPPWSSGNFDERDREGYYDDYNQGMQHEPNFDRRRPNQGVNFNQQRPPPDWHGEPMGDRQGWDQDNEHGNWRRDGPGGYNEEHNQNWDDHRGPGPPSSHPGPPPAPLMGGVNPDEAALVPKVPYYDLPAGLMAPLVNLEDMDYKELDPALIRLPPPIPPSDRLLAAVEAFYGPPSHERPRNAEGWEHNGLFEFFRAKVRAKRRAQQGRRQSRSRSRSPDRRSHSRNRSSSRSRSRSTSRSRSSRSRSRSNSRSPGRRPTPPSFGPAYYQRNANAAERLGEENRGAQMMKKMGWGGAGLGSIEQGIQDPVKAGDVRDKYDQFKGLGMDMNDPYENYRKNRSYGYGPRMRGGKGD